jgi:hypothetical protein
MLAVDVWKLGRSICIIVLVFFQPAVRRYTPIEDKSNLFLFVLSERRLEWLLDCYGGPSSFEEIGPSSFRCQEEEGNIGQFGLNFSLLLRTSFT